MSDLPVRPGGDRVVAQAAADGRQGWLDLPTGRWVPLIAGGDGEGEGGEGDPGGTPPGGEGGDPGGSAEGTDPEGGSGGEGLTAEQAQAEARAARQEAAKFRKRAQEAEAKLKAEEDAKKSELEKAQSAAAEAQKKADDAEARLKKANTETLVRSQARTLGFADEDVAAALLDTSGIDYDDDGRPDRDEIRKRLQTLAKDKPHLLGGGGGSPGNPNQPKGGLSIDDVKAHQNDPNWVNENWDEVRKVLATQK